MMQPRVSQFIAFAFALVTVGIFIVAPMTASAASRPNIVVILADDFGYGSLGCYGAPADLKTPNIDRLAREGRRFTQAYAPGSVCSPTRYGLLTGRYYWRTSIKDGEVVPGNGPLHIETNRLTLASLCKQHGYRTAAVGKWHLGLGTEQNRDWSKPLRPGPLEIGFDYFFGLASNPWSGPQGFIENHHVLGKIPGEAVVVDGRREESTTRGLVKNWDEHQIMRELTQKAVAWMEQRGDEPFMLYFAPNAVHRPISPNPNFTGSPYGSYGDFVHELDWSVGQLLQSLDQVGKTKDTLVIFTSDNGGVVAERFEDEISVAREKGLAVNGPLRGGKHDIWEGGFREPFVVRWPGKVPAGTVNDQMICLTDVVATVAGILNVKLPPGEAEDSFNVGEAFFADSPMKPIRDHLILQDADATYAIRMGDWKLIEHVDAPPYEHRNKQKAQQAAKKAKTAPKHDELYSLKDDPAETTDVASTHVDRAARMKQILREARDKGFTRPDAG